MVAKLSAEGREWRRLQAVKLHEEGWSQYKIAKALGVTQAVVSYWLSRFKTGGIQALESRPHPGAPNALSKEQLEQLPILLKEGAIAHGFNSELWTRARIADLIARKFDICYSHAHISKIMRKIGFSLQKPRGRAAQRNEQRITQWREQDAVELKKKQTKPMKQSFSSMKQG